LTCVVSEVGPDPADTVRIALTEAVAASRAPVPATDAEGLVFRQLYEPLVDLDCDGAPRAALAVAWRPDAEGRRWTFSLRAGAAFWDGTPLDADALLAGWQGSDSTVVLEGVRADERTITVYLTEPRPVEFFARPALRVVKRIRESPWPVGTGPWWLGGADTSAVMLVAQPTGLRGRARPLAFALRPGADARDLFDAGADLVVTRDARARTYVDGRAGWVVAELPWDRTYVLASPALGDGTSADFTPEFRAGLARDVVPGDARAATGSGAIACDRLGTELPDRPLQRRLVYPRHDAAARALAERLVARADLELATIFAPPRLRGGLVAAGLPQADFDAARAAGMDLGYVYPTLGEGAPPCATPLVQTRPLAFVREGSARVVRDTTGVRILPDGPWR
jgi:peptide/nickel transport system substrate-binding protein